MGEQILQGGRADSGSSGILSHERTRRLSAPRCRAQHRCIRRRIETPHQAADLYDVTSSFAMEPLVHDGFAIALRLIILPSKLAGSSVKLDA